MNSTIGKRHYCVLFKDRCNNAQCPHKQSQNYCVYSYDETTMNSENWYRGNAWPPPAQYKNIHGIVLYRTEADTY